MADKNEEMTIPESEKNVSAATAEETAPSAEETVTETTTGKAETFTECDTAAEKTKKEDIPEEYKSAGNHAVTIISRIFTVLLILGCLALGIIGYRRGAFSSVEALQAWMDSYGIWAPLIFIILQAVQVVIPIIPGGVTLLGGVILFGPWWGFVYNYIGIIAGSFAVFGISRVYGKPLMYRIFKPESIEKYENWTSNHGRFAKLFAIAIFLPGAPDGVICYLAGTTQMTWKLYTLIILTAKPASIALYSVLYLLGIDSLSELIAALKK